MEKKDKDENSRMKEEHQKFVGGMMSSAEEGSGFLHRTTKPAAWRFAGTGGRCQAHEEM